MGIYNAVTGGGTGNDLVNPLTKRKITKDYFKHMWDNTGGLDTENIDFTNTLTSEYRDYYNKAFANAGISFEDAMKEIKNDPEFRKEVQWDKLDKNTMIDGVGGKTYPFIEGMALARLDEKMSKLRGQRETLTDITPLESRKGPNSVMKTASGIILNGAINAVKKGVPDRKPFDTADPNNIKDRKPITDPGDTTNPGDNTGGGDNTGDGGGTETNDIPSTDLGGDGTFWKMGLLGGKLLSDLLSKKEAENIEKPRISAPVIKAAHLEKNTRPFDDAAETARSMGAAVRMASREAGRTGYQNAAYVDQVNSINEIAGQKSGYMTKIDAANATAEADAFNKQSVANAEAENKATALQMQMQSQENQLAAQQEMLRKQSIQETLAQMTNVITDHSNFKIQEKSLGIMQEAYKQMYGQNQTGIDTAPLNKPNTPNEGSGQVERDNLTEKPKTNQKGKLKFTDKTPSINQVNNDFYTLGKKPDKLEGVLKTPFVKKSKFIFR